MTLLYRQVIGKKENRRTEPEEDQRRIRLKCAKGA